MSPRAFPATPNRRRMPDRCDLERIGAELAADDAALARAELEDAHRAACCAGDMAMRAEIERAWEDVMREAEVRMAENKRWSARRRNLLAFAEVMLWLTALLLVALWQVSPGIGLGRGLALMGLALAPLAAAWWAAMRAWRP